LYTLEDKQLGFQGKFPAKLSFYFRITLVSNSACFY